jgi:hypothetical protein
MHFSDTQFNVERVMLEKFKFAVNHYMDESFMIDIEVEQRMDMIARRVAYQFRTEIAGQKLKDFYYPANWKEAFKDRWFPKWLKKKFPVKFTYLEVKALYPQLHLPKEEYAPVFHVYRPETIVTDIDLQTSNE